MRANLRRPKDINLLSRLMSDARMEKVWAELYKKRYIERKQSKLFYYPARTTNATIAESLRQEASKLRNSPQQRGDLAPEHLEAEAALTERQPERVIDPGLSEQDRGAQLFLYHAWDCATNITPVNLQSIKTELREIREIAASLRQYGKRLRSLKMTRQGTKITELSEECEDEANGRTVDHEANDPWVIVRDRGDSKERTFVTSLSVSVSPIFGKPLHSPLAGVANVVFQRNDITAAIVREWLRGPRVR